jgi:hypothetical protein
MKTKAAVFAFAFCLVALSAAAQRSNMDEPWERHIHITQGPSVVEETGTAATLTWTTDRPSATDVRYRVWEGEWKRLNPPGHSTDHAVRLTDLRPGRGVEWEILAHDGDIRTSGHFRAREERDAGFQPGGNGAYGGHVPIYRADQPQTGQSFYTANTHEIRRMERQGWKSVGIVGYVAPQPSEIPVYRVWVPNGDHFYTTSTEERDEVVRHGGRDEGVLGYISKDPRPGARAWHRMVSTKNGMHLYSADPHEVWEAVTHQGYRDEGVIGYIWMQ